MKATFLILGLAFSLITTLLGFSASDQEVSGELTSLAMTVTELRSSAK